MAYIPPHKRHSKDSERPSPTPDMLVPQFKNNLSIGASKSSTERRKDKHTIAGGKIIYADHAISRWFAVGMTDDKVNLQPISLESFERRTGQKPFAIVNTSLDKDDNAVSSISQSPWVSIAELLKKDLLSLFDNVRNEMDCHNMEEVKATLVARFGKILFHSSPSVSLETSQRSSVTENMLRQLKRSFNTNIPNSYMDNIIGAIAPKIGVDFEEEKDIYHIKLSDKTQPDVTISCKCNVRREDNRLEIYKMELNPVRHMVLDISCLSKDLDLRLMLSSKRILTALTDDEKHGIRDLVDSAVLDPDVKGGLRWPIGKASFGDGYTIVGVWHTVAKSYKNSSMRLKVRHADRFDFRNSTGETTKEISLKLKKITSEIQEKVEIDLVSNELKDTLKLIWDNFL